METIKKFCIHKSSSNSILISNYYMFYSSLPNNIGKFLIEALQMRISLSYKDIIYNVNQSLTFTISQSNTNYKVLEYRKSFRVEPLNTS